MRFDANISLCIRKALHIIFISFNVTQLLLGYEFVRREKQIWQVVKLANVE